MRTTPRAAGIAAAMALGLLSACGSSAGSDAASDSTAAPTTTAAPASGGGDLFVVTATGGTLDDESLVLTGADAKVTAFADRPQRTTDREPLSDFVGGWAKQGFADDPPNAALVTRSDGRQVTTVVELGKPTVDGDSVTFPVTRLSSGEATGALAHLASQDQPDELAQPSLYIDAGTGGTLVPISISGTWGVGTTKAALDGWDLSESGGTMMGFEMGDPSTISFTAYDAFFTLVTPKAITGTFFGVGLIDASSLGGQAVVPAGSDLTIDLCGTSQTSTAFVQGQFDIPIPDSC